MGQVCAVPKVTMDKLQCPFDSMQYEAESWYDSFCRSIQKSRELGCMPFETPLLTLDLNREELSQLSCDNWAKWHKLCKNQFSTLKLERAQKRQAIDSDGKHYEGRKKLPRRSTETEVRQGCCFCEESSGELHRASTLNLDGNVRESARILNNTLSLGKLSDGDVVACDAMYHIEILQKSCKREKSMCHTD